jgi:hypothetical protein
MSALWLISIREWTRFRLHEGRRSWSWLPMPCGPAATLTNVHKRDLHQIHFMAWKKGLKSLYYCRSMSIQRADNVSERVKPLEQTPSPSTTDYDECLACE